MSFREKIHWVALVTMIFAFGWYFLQTPWRSAGGPQTLWASAGLLFAATLAVVVLMTAATAIMAIRNRDEVNLKEDERDRSIHWRGTHLAYYPMVVGTWSCIGLIFAGVDRVILLNVLLAMVVLAELLRIGWQIWLYRKGA
jgi:hypothetical protein